MNLTSKPFLITQCSLLAGLNRLWRLFLKHLVGSKGEKGYINFGIDLVGGTYLTLDVKVEEAVKNDLLSAMSTLVDNLKKEKKGCLVLLLSMRRI